ncbi:hypothetical protein A2U01_0091952, partial [Trifolium medium]|nr:hypothetical protein [Trifolium medium]
MLSHLLSARQEKEVAEARARVERVEKTVADIESRYTAAKEKWYDEVNRLKQARKDDAANFKKESDAVVAKVKEDSARELE